MTDRQIDRIIRRLISSLLNLKERLGDRVNNSNTSVLDGGHSPRDEEDTMYRWSVESVMRQRCKEI